MNNTKYIMYNIFGIFYNIAPFWGGILVVIEEYKKTDKEVYKIRENRI